MYIGPDPEICQANIANAKQSTMLNTLLVYGRKRAKSSDAITGIGSNIKEGYY